MIFSKPCPTDCYLIEKVPDIEDGDYDYVCKIKKRETKCIDYQKKIPGIRSEDPIIVYHAINGHRWKKITITISILAVLTSIFSMFISNNISSKIKRLENENRLLIEDNIFIKRLFTPKIISSNPKTRVDTTKTMK